MNTLKDFQSEEIYTIVDLLASEYGWQIEYIQGLSIAEILGLIHCILKRKGLLKPDGPSGKVVEEDPVKNLMALARKLKATPEQMDNLKQGKGIVL